MAGVPGKSGGARAGAGRKPKPKVEPVPVPATISNAKPGQPFDPRPTLELVAQGLLEVSPQQYKALTALLPFVHAKVGEGGKKDQKKAAAEKAATGKFGLRAVK